MCKVDSAELIWYIVDMDSERVTVHISVENMPLLARVVHRMKVLAEVKLILRTGLLKKLTGNGELI